MSGKHYTCRAGISPTADRSDPEQPTAKVISLTHGLKFLVWMAMVVLYAGGSVSHSLVARASAGLRSLGVVAAVWVITVGLTWLYCRATV